MRKKIKLLDGSLSYPIEEKGYKLNTNLWTGEILIKNPQVIEFLKKHKIDYIHIPWRHRYFWDGGLHCITLDLKRR